MKLQSAPPAPWLNGSACRNSVPKQAVRSRASYSLELLAPMLLGLAVISTPSIGDGSSCTGADKCPKSPVVSDASLGFTPNVTVGLAHALATALSSGRRRWSGSCAAAGLRSMSASISVQREILPLLMASHHVPGTPPSAMIVLLRMGVSCGAVVVPALSVPA